GAASFAAGGPFSPISSFISVPLPSFFIHLIVMTMPARSAGKATANRAVRRHGFRGGRVGSAGGCFGVALEKSNVSPRDATAGLFAALQNDNSARATSPGV